MSTNTLYLEDKQGSITPEVSRYTQVSGFAHNLCYASADINNAAAEMLRIADSLGPNRPIDDDGRLPGFTFPSEVVAKEELIKLAGLMRRLNHKVWGVSRMISRDAEDVASRVIIADDQKFDAELEAYLKSDPSADLKP
jgi:hypothetical protein